MTALRRARTPLTVLLGVGLVAALAAVLAGHKDAFAQAMSDVPYWTLLLAVALHAISLIARSEAWLVSVHAAGGTVDRRHAHQAASLGYAANCVATSLGAAVRIAALRRACPDRTPTAPALVAAEVPVLAAMALFGAVMSFTLVDPLGLPWWAPLAALGVAVLVIAGLRRFARHHEQGIWRGLGALKTARSRTRVGGMVAVILACQIARNMLLLGAVGLDAGPLEATAMLIGVGVVGFLPVGPTAGASASLLIFGAAGVAPAAAAGVLLTVTGLVADLAYAAWGCGDMVWRTCPRRLRVLPRAADLAAATACTALLGVAAI